MKKKMLAVVKKSPGIGAQLEEIEIPQLGPKDVLVRVKATAICGTDLHIYDWNTWAENAGIHMPVVMGHEFSGEIVEVGSQVNDLNPGDYVAGETHIPCGKCYQCNNGQQHICGNLQIFGVHTDGCFAEYTKIPAICARKIPNTISPEIGAVLEPLGTAIRSTLDIEVSGKKIAVIGCGPIGLFAIASAKAMGASCIIAIDVMEERLKLSKEIGANIAINPKDIDVVNEVMEITNGVGVDGFIDASGSTQAINQGFKYLRKGGEVALIGLPSAPISLDLGPDVVFKEAKIIGIHGREMFQTWIRMENMLEEGLLNINPVITHTMPLAKFEDAIELLKAGIGNKIVLIP
ncbi:L-threonine 3-dehydrogenase [Natronincola peptidivorans]|uniref:L-threonine 3-dehydrogenase n=1 Tax=Natronincola peptidivorans TaxID=426128 RepID=A0A1I0BMJ6_9FIRM|nr:L-threonine 3-dehydrogenase [Natronincola peptidivorans]SET08178.1 L-threonine 3-dehydrogenase [Natronincola peptidivorans]